MSELNFTIEFNGEGLSETAETVMFQEADTRLRALASDHHDMTGAAITIREPAHGHTTHLYEATIAVYIRPEQIAATEKHTDPMTALKGALDAIERQVRQKRDRLGEPWKRPDIEHEMAQVEEGLSGDPDAG